MLAFEKICLSNPILGYDVMIWKANPTNVYGSKSSYEFVYANRNRLLTDFNQNWLSPGNLQIFADRPIWSTIAKLLGVC